MNDYLFTVYHHNQFGLVGFTTVPFRAASDLAAVESAECRARLLDPRDAAILETVEIGTYDPASSSFGTRTPELLWDATRGRTPKLGAAHRAAELAEYQVMPPSVGADSAEFGPRFAAKWLGGARFPVGPGA